ncbi:acetoacetate--CoA ligase [Desulfosarcina sp.]|uniref:acetoacetate--CoA ligase n=1 Tax=Desulfosarcina sp. TaxID=2027861 RepID=UPI0029A5914D|nr:acetoacetate--CoA ligase [Desulfosarcina sp.]MDX2454689.1 acetoacetate--CoA ligase [Desulfosarcina sp.]
MSRLLWTPSRQRREASNIYQFMQRVNASRGLCLENYNDLYTWSVNHISDFWEDFWETAEIVSSKKYHRVLDDENKMPGARWFEGARLNFAENLLRFRDDKTALIFRGEDRVRRTLTYAQLYRKTASVAAALRAQGVEPGDRVTGFMPNMPETIIFMLAAASIGAAWSSCSPDFGIKGVMDRFGQIQPKVLVAADGYFFKGKPISILERVAGVMEQIPSIEKMVVVPYIFDAPDISDFPNAVAYADFCMDEEEIVFEQLPFDHPLYIMYSSGTTGLPKCMVQSAGGVLVHQMKELMLHTDLKREDTLFYFTTCGWMMWNWLTCGLSLGATLVLYDGNPFHPAPDALWRMAQEEKITIFGTSAGYIAALRNAGVRPGEEFDLSRLRTLLSTGSPLSAEDFDFIYEEVKGDLQLSSISGGSDLNGCFALGNPMGPVYAGELQCRGLGMKVVAYDLNGKPAVGVQGELVCEKAFPSMPVEFWNDTDGARYHSAYFDVYPGVWTHGDFIEITPRGGVIIHGRSDATLNPGGVRIGTAEIYRRLEQMTEIDDSVVVGQSWNNDVRVVLFVKMAEGEALTDALENRIRIDLRTHASPRHVPAKIIAVPDIPYTLNMKKVELAVRHVIHGRPVKNTDALKNPDVLDFYRDLEALTV